MSNNNNNNPISPLNSLFQGFPKELQNMQKANTQNGTAKNSTENKTVILDAGSERLKGLRDLAKHTAPAVKEYTPHAEILDAIDEKIKPINFYALAFPATQALIDQLREKDKDGEYSQIQRQLKTNKLKYKHYFIFTISEIFNIADQLGYKFAEKNGMLSVYNGAFWSLFDSDFVEGRLMNWSISLGVPELIAKDHNFLDELWKQFKKRAKNSWQPKILPTRSVYINLQNGTYHISPDKGISRIEPFNPEHQLYYQLQFEYNPDATAPIFQNYLDRVLPDKTAQNVLAEYLGYVFIRHNTGFLKLEKALVLYGSGANGKSVFYEVVTALLGRENVSTHSLTNLTKDDGYYRAAIENKLVNYCSEISNKLEAETFKQLVSGEGVSARPPYCSPKTITNYAKLIFNANELPTAPELTHAYFRRFLIIPFNVRIPENEQDPELHRKIIEHELSGVFNWVLQGLERLLAQKKFTECAAANELVKRYRMESDSVALFMYDKGYKSSKSKTELRSLLYNEYNGYCIDNGYRPVGNKVFAKRLDELGYLSIRKENGFVVYVELA
jgi:putative DNA primase/helicase